LNAGFTGSETLAIQNAATNRAVGVRQSGAFGDPGAAFVLQLTNTAGLSNLQFTLDFQMLSVQPRSTTWSVDYGLGATPSTFTTVGITFTDPGVFGNTNLAFNFGTALDNQNQNVWIRVVALSASTGSGSRDTFGIDNFKLSWSGTPVTGNNLTW